jgi:GNAT superfamily N-acetyltransferase
MLAAVVTSLEMLARPAIRPEARSDSWPLRPVTMPEPGWYRDLFRRVGQDWLWESRLRLTDPELAAVIRHPAVEIFVPLVEGRPEGLVELDFRVDGECELSFFGLTPVLIGRGAGRWLMNRAIERAWSRPIRRFWVHTCSLDHPAALDFYRRSGFVPFHRQVAIGPDPRLDGTLPREAAPQVPIL